MTRHDRDPRADELLADDALFGLSDDERRELEALGAEDDPTFALAAAAADLATLRRDEVDGPGDRNPLDPMPATLREAVLGAIDANAAPMRPMPHKGPQGSPARAPGRAEAAPRARVSIAGWVAAAACAVLAAGGWWAYATKAVLPERIEVQLPSPPAASIATPSPAPPDPRAQRADLLQRTADAVTVPWKATKDPAGRAVTGDVVWSQAEQRGFMRFNGLPPNDPATAQYQLWVFDKTQDHPIDGGVFDVRPGADAVIAVEAKLHVTVPTAFAVTIEKPGGVVVSKQKHIVALAVVSAG